MNLGANSRFSMSVQNPIQRSVFDRSNTLLTSFSSAKLIPVYVDEVLPGDTVTMDMSSLVRMATPLYPVMDNCYLDIFWFFVPNRLVWDNWKYFMGETKDAWDDDSSYEVPSDNVASVSRDYEGFYNVYDYFGLPIESTGAGNAFSMNVSSLYRRAYQLIWNEWFRDQNLQDSLLIDTGDTGISSNDMNHIPEAFRVLPVNKYKDYFTSCLPEPQRGADVNLLSKKIPVVSDVDHRASWVPLNVRDLSGNVLGSDRVVAIGAGQLTTKVVDAGLSSSTPFQVTNLWADPDAYLEGQAYNTINDLRRAFAVQRLLEADARGGTRYREMVKAHFGVDVGDARVQVPEYLGGAHVPINVMQVVQQSSTLDEPSPLGETGAFSKTVHRQSMFTKSFVEHGILMGLVCVRTDHSYQQGIRRMWSRKNRYDFYWPELANIGEQAVLNKEIYADGSSSDKQVFGYQEAWADYRYRPNEITGEMRQREGLNVTMHSLAQWHYGDFYSGLPALSDEWIRETDENIARTLAVTDTDLSEQFFGQMFFKARWARPMPVYSIPGLNSHF